MAISAKVLAVDLDGTLLSPDGTVSSANVAAVHAAREAGLRVVVCTGRGLTESRRALTAIDQREPCIVVGGAIIACPQTGSTHHRFAIPLHTASAAVEAVVDHGFPALVFKDPAESAYDYLVVTGADDHPLDPVTRWWFGEMGLRVRTVRTLDDDDHPEHTVRVGACGLSGRMASLSASIARACADDTVMHHFPAVVAPDHAKVTAEGQTLHIFEMFSGKATKWSAVSLLARQWGIAPSAIVAIGDQINDVSMIEGAGLGIAMGNAIPEVTAHADFVTRPNTHDGVAHAITQVLCGAWAPPVSAV